MKDLPKSKWTHQLTSFAEILSLEWYTKKRFSKSIAWRQTKYITNLYTASKSHVLSIFCVK